MFPVSSCNDFGEDDGGGMPKSEVHLPSMEGTNLNIVKEPSAESTNMLNKIFVSTIKARQGQKSQIVLDSKGGEAASVLYRSISP